MSEPSTGLPRLVLDTNIVVAGLLWHGPPRRLLERRIADAIELYSSPVLLEELAHTLAYSKFTARIERFSTTIATLVAQYTALISPIVPVHVPRIVRDPDDDHVIACALAARAELIVSGDRDLLDLGVYQTIRTVTARAALQHIDARDSV